MLSPDKSGLVWINDLTGGLNTTDAPQDLAPNQCQIAQNIEWVRTRFAQRRQGGVNSIHVSEPWGANTTLHALMRHTPTADETTAELWGVDNSATPVLAHLVASNQFVAVFVVDAWTLASVAYLNGASFNGKFFIAGNTAVDRLHVWDGADFRRVGVATPAAPTVADTGAGTYPAIPRFYKVQWVNDDVTPNVFSELSPAVAFTPSGAGAAARVTRPAPPGDGETRWRVYASPDDVNYYVLGGALIATTFIDDSTAPTAYSTLFPQFAGVPTDADYFTPPISPKYVLVDEDRLILLSSWETPSMASAVMWTPVLGTTPAQYAVADDERVPSTNRLDLDRSDGGGITGGAILNGTVYVFKLSHIYRLVRTGDVTLPYRGIPVTKSLGAISHKSIVVGEDDAGNACLYFLSRRGPYRLTTDGLEYLGRDLEATWDTVVVDPVFTPAFGVWHQKKRQVQWWVTIGVNPDTKLVFHARHGRRDDAGNVRGGWAVHTEGAAAALSAVMFANTLGASMSLDLKPYVGQIHTVGQPDGPCIKYDADGVVTDRGALATGYVGQVKTAAFPPGGHGQKGGILSPYVLAVPTDRALSLHVVRDFGAETRTGTVIVPAPGLPAVSRAPVKVADLDDVGAADARYAEVILDDVGSNAAWTVDAIGFRPRVEGPI